MAKIWNNFKTFIEIFANFIFKFIKIILKFEYLKFKINYEKRYWDFEYVHLLIFVINSKYLNNYKHKLAEVKIAHI